MGTTITNANTSRESSNLAGLRNPARTGQREARDIGEDLTRQGRLRIDMCQTERRLNSAYCSLGEVVCRDLAELRGVSVNDNRVVELLAHIHYYQDELARLKAEMKAAIEAA